MKRLNHLHLILVTLLAGIFLTPLPLQAAKISGDPGGHTNRGVKYAKKKEYEKAIEEFTKAIEKQPKDPKNYRNRALTYRLMGDAKNPRPITRERSS
ncbi:MAG: tetratricopeptide repeat protein [Chthoniobacterales bacterium]|nr:tetratricopeptide repeat protein [Chthoniobacterales bacterium]